MMIKKARLDTRITTEQKESFEKATRLGGYRSLTHFVVESAEENAENFYSKYGFINLTDSGKMFIPMKTIKGLG